MVSAAYPASGRIISAGSTITLVSDGVPITNTSVPDGIGCDALALNLICCPATRTRTSP